MKKHFFIPQYGKVIESKKQHGVFELLKKKSFLDKKNKTMKNARKYPSLKISYDFYERTYFVGIFSSIAFLRTNISTGTDTVEGTEPQKCTSNIQSKCGCEKKNSAVIE